MIPIDALRTSAGIAWKEKKQLLPVLLADFSFFVLFALVHTLIVLQALPALASINQLVAQESLNVPQLPDMTGAENVDLSQLNLSFPVGAFQGYYANVMNYALLYILALFVLYNLFFAFGWQRVLHVLHSGKKKGTAVSCSYPAYLRRFFGINLLYLVLLIAGFYALIFTLSAAMFGQVTLISEKVVSGAWAVLALLLAYFGVISHALLFDHGILQALKQSVILGIRKILRLGATFVLVAFIYYLIVQLLAWLGLVSAALSFALFLLLFVPWLAVSKAVFVTAVQEAAKR